MATMIPHGIQEFKTEGEGRFYRFLESVAKPDQKYTTWYLPDIEGREPDFILFCDEIGLIIFEVKDWSLDQIKEATPRSFVLRMGREKRSLKNPLQQAREYFESLMARIRADGKLLSKEPEYYGKPKVPIEYGVVFPNINRDSYCQSGLNKVISPKRIFFWDDLHSASEICTDGSGECFKKALLEMFPPRFRFSITPTEYSHLKQLIFPVIRIDPPQRDTCAYVDPSHRIHVLDDRQEAVARRCFAGAHIVSGPSGSGKTLILCQKAAFIRQYTSARRILFVCFNITLVNYIKRMLMEKGVGLGPDGVEVFHFFELCSKILGKPVQYDEEDGSYYEQVAEEALARLGESPFHYEAILVDEGQDFTDEMLRVIEALAARNDGQGDAPAPNLTVALDEGQNIYGRELAWKKACLQAGGRMDKLSTIYRNTTEIRRLALGFMGMEHSEGDASSASCETHGPKPEIKQMSDVEHLADSVANTIRMLFERREYPLSEMAVLYARRRMQGNGQIESLPELLATALESRGIMTNWVAEDHRAKRSYDITTDRVTISTIHSVKGLDYGCVFLIGLDELETGQGWPQERIERMISIGITRARHRLFIPFIRKSSIIRALQAHLTALGQEHNPFSKPE